MTVPFLFRGALRVLVCATLLALVGLLGCSHSVSAMVQDATTGDYYGTTRSGGKYGQGTVFHLDPNFGLTVLYSFAGGSDGADPTGTLILVGSGKSGILYGTTLRGGNPDLGTVFRIGTNGSGYVRLHDFVGGSKDGASPYAGVIFTSTKTLYGTTLRGGRYGAGTVYSLLLAGGATTLRHEFAGGAVAGVPPDGAVPYARLLEYKKGTIVGTTLNGGMFGQGTVYGLNFTASMPYPQAIIYPFAGGFSPTGVPDGAHPYDTLIQSNLDGNLYGTTQDEGAHSLGTIFQAP